MVARSSVRRGRGHPGEPLRAHLDCCVCMCMYIYIYIYIYVYVYVHVYTYIYIYICIYIYTYAYNVYIYVLSYVCLCVKLMCCIRVIILLKLALQDACWELINTPLLQCHPDRLTVKSRWDKLVVRVPRGMLE